MPKSKTVPSDSSSSSSSSDEYDSSSDDVRVSEIDEEDSDEDVKDQYLLKGFQPKPIKVVVSNWAKRKMRGPFLGTPIGREERDQLIEDYFCSPEDWKLFSVSRTADSPLALMVTSDSTALKDLTKIHSDLLFSLRIGLISYEKVLSLAAMWAAAKTNPLTQKTLPAGDWFGLSYRFKQSFPVPIPWKIREDVPDTDVDSFLGRDFMVAAAGERSDKLVAAIKYGLSYKVAFDALKESANMAHSDALRLDDALGEVKTEATALAKDTGSSMRLLGGVCQLVKSMRETTYTKHLDSGFKKYLAQKKSSRTQDEAVEARAGGSLVDEDLAGEAKRYGKLRKAMELVTKESKKREKFKKFHANKKASTSGSKFGEGTSKASGQGQTKNGAKRKYKAPKKAKKVKKQKKDKSTKDE